MLHLSRWLSLSLWCCRTLCYWVPSYKARRHLEYDFGDQLTDQTLLCQTVICLNHFRDQLTGLIVCCQTVISKSYHLGTSWLTYHIDARLNLANTGQSSQSKCTMISCNVDDISSYLKQLLLKLEIKRVVWKHLQCRFCIVIIRAWLLGGLFQK